MGSIGVGLVSTDLGGASADESSVVALTGSPILAPATEPIVIDRSTGRNLDGHRVLDDPDCGGRVVNNSYVSPAPVSRYGNSVIYSTSEVGGPIGVFGFARKGETSFPSDGVVEQSLTFSDGSGVVQWFVDSRPFAILSVKRMDGITLERLANAIVAGDAGGIGFEATPLATEGATVELSTCMTANGFVGIEVVRGERSARLAYLLDVDPTRVVEYDDALLVEGDRRGGDGPAITRRASDDEWSALVAATRAAGGE